MNTWVWLYISLSKNKSFHLTIQEEKKCESTEDVKFKVYFSWSKCTMIHLFWQSTGRDEEAAHSQKV